MFSFRLKQLREKAGWTQEELAAKLNLTQSTIAYYENDRKKPTLENAKIIARLFNISLDFLIGFTDNINDVALKEEYNNYSISCDILEDIRKLSPQGKKDLENFIELLKLRDKQLEIKDN
ncbi:MAG: helix-turn-helix transcriptional regulator [Clostridiales bacterium]|nr:helix-turn-helix transcriptional regulator [Clostridiales bacterium]